MSSVVLWKGGLSAGVNRVTVSWEKSGGYSVFVLDHIDANGVAHGTTKTYSNEKSAIRAAQRKSWQLMSGDNR